MESTRVHDPAAITKGFAPGAAGKQQQQQQQVGRNGAVPAEDDQFEGDILLENSDNRNSWVKDQGDGRFPIRAPVSNDAEEIGDDEESEGSFGSEESFDSALERMAASSTASNEVFASPVGSYATPGDSPGHGPNLGLESSQQGALMRLNELNSGVSSLDPSLINSSGTGDEFRARVVQIARKNDLSADDAAVRNILDLLIPLIGGMSHFSVDGNGSIDGSEDGVSGVKGSQRANEPVGPRPVAKVTEEDDPLNNSDEDGEESEEPSSEEAEYAESDDLHSEAESDIKVAQSAQGLRVVGGNEAELGEERIAGSEPAVDKVVTADGNIGGLTEFVKGEVDEKTEPIEGEDDENTGSDSPLHEFNSISEFQESEQSLPESHGGEDAKMKIEEQILNPEESLDTKSEKGEFSASALGEENLPKAEESTERDVKTLGLEVGNGSGKITGGSEEANEQISSEPEAAQSNNVAQVMSSDSDDKIRGILADMDVDRMKGEILADSDAEHRKEAVESHVTEGEETSEVARSSDLSPSLALEDAVTVDQEPEEARVSEGIAVESVKEEGERTLDGLDCEGASPKDPYQISRGNESKPADTIAAEDRGEEYMNDQYCARAKQNKSFEAGDEFEVGEDAEPHVRECKRADIPKVEEQQPKVEDVDFLTSQISAESEETEKEMKLEANPEDLPSELDFIKRSDEHLPTVAQSQVKRENGNVSALYEGTPTGSEPSQLPADVPKNQESKDASNGSSVSASFKDDDAKENRDDHWNEKEINVDDEEDDEDDALQSSDALAALMRAVNSSGGGSGMPPVGSAGPSLPARPAGLGRSMPSLEPTLRVVQQSSSNGVTASRPSAVAGNSQPNGEANDGNSETREKLQAIRVKFLRLAHRLGQSAQNVVVAQVLYRLGLAEQLRGGQTASRSNAFGFDRASAIAEEEEAAGEEELDFTCTIMLLGKTGVGKSATINSIFDDVRAPTNAFTFATRKVQEITGTVHGIKLRVIDTPGLLPSVADQRQNEKIMASVKRFIRKSPPDIVLYFDRLDMPSRDFGDIPLLRTITDTFGAAIWFNAIVVLTHASSAPPDGPNGVPVSYEMFVAQRSHVVQQTIRQAAGDTRLMNPVSLVENHPACRTNRAGERVLPNGQIWKPQLLLLSFASKILAEANSLLKLQESAPGKPFGTRSRVPPLPFLLSSLLQSRAQLKMPEEQMGDDDESDDDVDDDASDDEVEYDELPPFRRLLKEEIEELDKEQRRLYFEELDDREKLFQKKQWKEELRRRKELKKRMADAKKSDLPPSEEQYDEDGGKSAAVPVALPDMALPPSFDSDNPSHRYRYLESASQWLVRPVLETHGWDHDSGYDGLNLEKVFILGSRVPVSLSGQITKDKKEANVTFESAASLRHGEGKVTLAGVDVQTMGKDLSYTVRTETRFSNFKHNKSIVGLALTMLGDTIAAGLKLEDRLLLGKRLKLVMNGGAITGRGDVAFGGTTEITLKGKDYPISRTISTLGFSVMDWHGDLAIGGNLQSQFVIGKTMTVARANLNNRGAGQISIRASSSEQFQMALIAVIPIVRSLLGNRLFIHSNSA